MRSSKLKDKLSFILYENKTPPRYFEVNKGMMRFLFLVLPVISTIMIIVGIVFIARWNSYRTTELPYEVLKVTKELTKVQRENDLLTSQNEGLLKRLSSSDSGAGNGLSLFVSPNGQQDLTSDKYFESTEIKTVRTNGNLTLSFNLVNITPGNKRVSGHFIVMMKSESNIQFFPSTVLKGEKQRITFNSGEPFTTSRFRPVKAVFDINNTIKSAHFMVYVFSRVGDILYTTEFKREF